MIPRTQYFDRCYFDPCYFDPSSVDINKNSEKCTAVFKMKLLKGSVILLQVLAVTIVGAVSTEEIIKATEDMRTLQQKYDNLASRIQDHFSEYNSVQRQYDRAANEDKVSDANYVLEHLERTLKNLKSEKSNLDQQFEALSNISFD